MKRIIPFVLVFATVMTISGCNQKKTGTSSTTYVMKDCDDPLKPYVTLFQSDEGNRFSFLLSGVSNYFAYGEYVITGNHLTLSTDDGKEYSFKMEDDVLIFDAGNSSEIPSYKSFETPADNTIFELSK